MNRDNLAKQLGLLRPFQVVSTEALRPFAATLKTVELSKNDNYPLTNLRQNGFLLPLSGILTLHKVVAYCPRPFSVRLPLGGLWPTSVTTETEKFETVQPLSDGQFGIISCCQIQALLHKSAELRLPIVHSIGLAWGWLTELSDSRVTFTLSVQLARLLLELSQREGQQLIVPYTHEQIAALLSSHRETISTIIGQFGKRGWLKTKRGYLILLDAPALANVA